MINFIENYAGFLSWYNSKIKLKVFLII